MLEFGLLYSHESHSKCCKIGMALKQIVVFYTTVPATFERLMEKVLKSLQWQTLLLYQDDVIIFSKDFENHLERLAEICGRFLRYDEPIRHRGLNGAKGGAEAW